MTSNQINYWKLVESERAAKAQEAINTLKLQEEVRHNLATERQAYLDYGETQRSHKTNESENFRTHYVTEVETERHNRAVETETERHQSAVDSINMLSFLESERAHKANEALTGSSIGAAYANVSLGYANLAEQMRHNEVTEMELNRHQQTVEGETQRHNEATEGETARSNVTREKETERHNRESEYWTGVGTGVDMINTLIKGAGMALPMIL